MVRLSPSPRPAILVAALSLASLAHANDLALPVDFLPEAPTIDGRLDDALAHLPVRTFAEARPMRTDAEPVAAHYRLAYGADFLYLHVTAAGDSLTCRDRAYQNGDGLHLIVSRAVPDGEPTDEFYVLACSAVDRPAMEWSRRIFWYYNVHDIFQPVSDAMQLGTDVVDGTIQFELLLPWADVHPWHPWLGDGVGFDLAFCKATAPSGVLYYTARPYSRYLGVENQPRQTTPLQFAAPTVADGAQVVVQPDRRHGAAGEPVAATAVATTRHAGPVAVDLTLETGEGARAVRTRHTLDLEPGLSRHPLVLDTTGLPAGGYRFSWCAGRAGSGDQGRLTLLPPFDRAALEARLDAVADAVAPGSLTTLRRRLQELDEQLRALRPYESAGEERLIMARLLDDIAASEAGADPFATRRGFFRRAYRSTVDGSLQPYSVRIPDDYDPARRYPLLVFLHGSASDETELARFAQLNPGGWIEVGPRGRGPSNAWVADHAQEDVAEAVQDVQRNYTIDPERMVLCGVSMGGYGACRTHLNDPDRYQGVAVLSGTTRWPGHRDLRDPALLAPFDGVPVFVFHGARDRNCPHADAEDLVGLLRDAGAVVQFESDPDKGHEAMGPDALRAFHAWLRDRACG